MTDQITIPRALLEQALESLWQMTKKFNFERLHESRLSDSNVRVSAHDAMNAIRAELAKPATAPTASTFIRERAQLEQEWCVLKGMQQQYKNLPAWHDAPTCEGLWCCVDKDGYRVFLELDSSGLKWLAEDGERWYGPIPQDKEGEKS